MSFLTKYLGLRTEANDTAGEVAERIETVTEFLGDVSEKLPDFIGKAEDAVDHLPDLFNSAIEATAPWLSAAADAVGDALPPVKAILSIAKFLTRETNPHALGLLAVSVSYQAALADAANEIARDGAIRTRVIRPKSVRLSRAALGEPETPEAFEGFRLESALTHPLVLRADQALRTVAKAAGYPEDVGRALLEGVHVRFAEKFRATISDGRVKEKFDPLFRLMELGGREVATYAFLRRHLDYQLWRFTRAPALGRDGTLSLRAPLAQIFTPLDCGVLQWVQIRRASQPGSPQGSRRSPFDHLDEGNVPRPPLWRNGRTPDRNAHTARGIGLTLWYHISCEGGGIMPKSSRNNASKTPGRGRGRPFEKGNAGRPKGARHRVTVLAEKMMEDDAAAVVTAVLEAAKAGDITAARIILDRVVPARKGRLIKFTLPALKTASEIVRGLGAIIEAVADGTLTPDEGAAVANLMEIKRKAVETVEIERRVAALEQIEDSRAL